MAVVQFQTTYNHPSGRRRLRVTTVSHRYAEASGLDLVSGFDQEAAAVLMARLAVFKTEQEDCLDVLRWESQLLCLIVWLFPGVDQWALWLLSCLYSDALQWLSTYVDSSLFRWLDRKLIRLVSRFADYQKDDPASFHLSQEFSIYPQFMYHLRRSHFLQTFNAR